MTFKPVKVNETNNKTITCLSRTKLATFKKLQPLEHKIYVLFFTR